MNVRKTAIGTNLALIVLIVGLCFLIPWIWRSLPYGIKQFFMGRSNSIYYVGVFHGFVTKTAMWLIIIVCIIDAILKKRGALSAFSSLNIPIVLGIPVVIFVFIPVSAYIFWGLCYIASIIGVYWSFRKIIGNNQSGGQKLISFIISIKAGAGTGYNHISDHYIVFIAALVLVTFFALLLVSFANYAIVNWQA